MWIHTLSMSQPYLLLNAKCDLHRLHRQILAVQL